MKMPHLAPQGALRSLATQAPAQTAGCEGGVASPAPLTRASVKSNEMALSTFQSVRADYGVFQLGTPGHEFTGCFDTGSSDTWCTLPSQTASSHLGMGCGVPTGERAQARCCQRRAWPQVAVG